jgi:glycerol-3-phosphate dehydrogenase
VKNRKHAAERAFIDFKRMPQEAFGFYSGYSGNHSFDDCIDGADLLIIGASSIGNYEISQKLADKDIPKDVPIVILSKGIVEHKKRLYLPSEAMELFLPDNPIAMLSGLMFAEEIFENAHTFANIALNYASSVKKRLDRKKMYEYLKRIFNIGHLTTFKYDNILWVETGGAAKNVYGIASGYTNKMLHLRRKRAGKHDEDLYLNTLLSLAMYTGIEMQTIYLKLRSKERNPRDILIRTHVFTNRSIPAWDSDRYGTLLGRKSRNFRYGEFKAEGKSDQDPQIKKLGTIEGINTAKQLIRMFDEDEKKEEVPLLTGVNEWLAGKVTAEQVEQDLITYLRNVDGRKGSRRYVTRIIRQKKLDREFL